MTITSPIAPLVERAVREGVYFPHDPSGNGGVQIRLDRNATPEGHHLAAALRERRAEVNAFHAARRPTWPVLDDGIPPRINPDEPDATIFLIQLEAILFEDRVADFIEAEVAYVGERIAGIVARAVAARRIAAPVNITSRPRANMPRAVEFRGGKVVRR